MAVWKPASEIEEVPPLWLLDTPILKVPLGELTLVGGREASAKSMFTIWLAAGITNGTLPGELCGQKRHVIICAVEDSWARTITARLRIAGADLKMVGPIKEVTTRSTGRTSSLTLPTHLDGLAETIIRLNSPLVILDPIISHLGDINPNRAEQVRQKCEPMVSMLDELTVAGVGITHFSKAEGRDAMSLISGSGAWKDLARSVIIMVREDRDAGIISQLKCQGAPPFEFSGTFRVGSVMDPIGGRWVSVPWFWPGEQTKRHVEDLLDFGKARKKSEARDFLRTILGAVPGQWVSSAWVLEQAESRGIDEKTLQTARTSLGVERRKRSNGSWEMKLG